MTAVRDWLPKDAYTVSTLAAALDQTLRDWEGCWLRDSAVRIADVRRDLRLSQSPSNAWIRGQSGAVRCTAGGRGKRVLIELALGLDLEGQSLNEFDHGVVDLATKRMIEDLAARIDRLLAASGSDGVSGSELTVIINHQSTELVQISFSDSLIVSAIKSGLPRDSSPATFTNRWRALKDTEVTLEGLLGQIPLTIDELRGLSVGDVLVIDRPLSTPVDVFVQECGALCARGRLHKQNGRVAIQLSI